MGTLIATPKCSIQRQVHWYLVVSLSTPTHTRTLAPGQRAFRHLQLPSQVPVAPFAFSGSSQPVGRNVFLIFLTVKKSHFHSSAG